MAEEYIDDHCESGSEIGSSSTVIRDVTKLSSLNINIAFYYKYKGLWGNEPLVSDFG
jgi:hypothetical protein